MKLSGAIEFYPCYSAVKRRHGVCQNGDLLGPTHWATINRAAYKASKWYLVADFFLVLSTLNQWRKKDASDSINGLMQLLICYLVLPTALSKLAWWLACRLINYEKLFNEYFDNPKDRGAPFHIFCKPIFDSMKA
jgi:hypothetical protein